MRTAHIVLSVWLSLLLIFGGTAKEFLHLFTGHEDTVHALHVEDGALSFENEHHHCTFLSFALPEFYHDTSVQTFSVFQVLFAPATLFSVAAAPAGEMFRELPRGPPAFV